MKKLTDEQMFEILGDEMDSDDATFIRFGRAVIAADRAQRQAGSAGDSAFESWYSEYRPAHRHKQRARDAYAAGMGDPLQAPPPAAQPARVDEALRLAVERTREDLGPTGDNYPAVRKLLAFAEAHIVQVHGIVSKQ